MRSVAVILNVRKDSKRCLNKLLRPYAQTTMFEIALDKLGHLSADEKVLAAYDEEFKSKPRHESIDVYDRSLESVSVDGPLTTVFECVNNVKSDYFMFLNPCCTHIKLETLQRAIDDFKSSDYPSITSVTERRDWIFSTTGYAMVDGDKTGGDTKVSPISYRVAHVFHIVNRERFLRTNSYWTSVPGDPFLYKISENEAIDVDEELEFAISEFVYKM